jgi:2-hydroxy-3-keto-5-methylthiopentenyl-1-phosphate phosphatase
MCEGLRKFGEEKENEGLKKGLIEGENKAFVEAVENVAESFHISIEEACEKLKKDYETYLKIKETL